MKHSKEQAENTRELILKAALDEFSDKGFAVTRLEDIAKRAGVTRGAIYWHFENKMDVFSKIFCRKMEAIQHFMVSLIDEKRSPLENIRFMMVEFSRSLLTNEEHFKFANLQYSIEWTPEVVEQVRKTKEKHGLTMFRMFFDLIAQGQEQGEINGNIDAEAAVFSILATIIGIFHLLLEKNRNFSPELLENIVEISVNGLKR